MTKPQGYASTDCNGQRSDSPVCLDGEFRFLNATLREVQEKMIAAMLEAIPEAERFGDVASRDEQEAYIHELVTERFWPSIKRAKESIAEYGFEGEVWEPEGSKKWNGRAGV